MKRNRKSQRDLGVLWKAANKFSFPSFILFLSLTFLITASAYAAVTIVISYTDEEVGDREPFLKIYYKTGSEWVEAQNQVPNAEDNYVKGDIPQFGLETVLASFPPPPTTWSLISPPCRGQSFIRYDVITDSQITLDLSGVGILLDQFKKVGHYRIPFDCSGLSNGFYFLTMRSNGGVVASFKVTVVK